MQWVNTDYDLPIPGAYLTLSDRQARNAGLNIPELLKDDPGAIAAIVYDLIAELRPDLEGGVLIGIKYTLHKMHWEFWYLHRSLPGTNGTGFPTQPLIPE